MGDRTVMGSCFIGRSAARADRAGEVLPSKDQLPPKLTLTTDGSWPACDLGTCGHIAGRGVGRRLTLRGAKRPSVSRR